MNAELRSAIVKTATEIGIDPIDLATVMSYETAGTFDPWKKGPTTQWGTHRGLIQWGEPQARKYGVTKDTPISQQVEAAGRYLKDAGVRPGMGMLDVYSAINAGGVGRYNASDANNGGAPGTVRDKVETQMAGHRQNAMKLIGSQTAQAGGGVPMAFDSGTPAPTGAAQATERMAGGGMTAGMPAPLPTDRPGYQVQQPSDPVPVTIPGRKKVTDPALLELLNGGTASSQPTAGRKKVTDPALLEQLNGSAPQPAEASPQHLDFDGSNVEGYNPETGMVEQGPDRATVMRDPDGAFGSITSHEPGLIERGANWLYDQANSAGLPAARMRRDIQGVDAAVRGVADAATFGTADEIAAFAGAQTGAGGVKDNYTGNLTAQRNIDKADALVNPAARVGGQIAGGVAMGVIAAPAAAASLGGRIVQGATLGAGYGGAYGFGSGEGGAQNRGLNALSGAAVGGAGGIALPVVGTGIRKGYNALMDATARPAANALRSTVAPQRNALGLVQRSLARDGLTPDMAAGKMREATAAGDDSMMLVDVAGDNTRRLGRFATNIPGEGANEIKDKVFERQLAQPDRVIEAIKKGLDDPEVYYQTVDDIIQQRATTAKPLYERFYASPVPFTKKLEDLLGRGSVMRTALRKARDMADAEGVPFQQFFANIAEDGSYTIKRVPDARAWDQIKRSLDDIVSENTQVLPNGTEKLNNFGRVVSNIRREMLDEIDGLAPAYGQARKAYSSASESLEAVTRGGKLLDADPELARRTLSKMTPEDAQLARIGISKALVDRVQKSKDGLNVVRGIFGSPRQRAVLKEAFPSKEAFDEFKATMFREAQKSRTKSAVTGNSTTAQQVTDLADNQMDGGVIGNLATGRFGAAAGAIIQKALARATVVNEATAKEIASIITSTDPQVAQQILGQMQQMAARDQRVAQNLANVQNLLRNSGIVTGTQQGTQALTPR